MLTPDISAVRDRFDMYEKEKAMYEATQRQRVVTFEEVALSITNADDTDATCTAADVAITTSTSPKHTCVTVTGAEDTAPTVMSDVSGPSYTDIENGKWLPVDEAAASSCHNSAPKGSSRRKYLWKCTIL